MPNSSTLPVDIVTMDLTVTPPVEEQTRLINFAKPSDRKWLENHMFWAAYNGRGIAFNPAPARINCKTCGGKGFGGDGIFAGMDCPDCN